MSRSFLQATTDTGNLSTYTFTAQNLGTAAAGRYIVVAISSRKAGAATTITGVTIGGVTATIVTQVANTVTNTNVAGIAIAAVPTGATGDIVVTFGASMARCNIGVYRVDNLLSATPYDTDTSIANNPSVGLDVPYGFAIGVGTTAVNGASTTWAGLTEDYDAVSEVAQVYTGASVDLLTAEAGRTMTATFTTASESAGVFASWGFVPPPYTGRGFFGFM
jgi:hypothetical protein